MHVAQGPEHRREAQHQPHLGRDPGAGHGGGEGLGPGQVRRQRLLAEHGAAPRHGRLDDGAVGRGRRAHPHGVTALEHLGDARDHLGPVDRREAGGAFLVEVVHGHHGGVEHPGPDHGLEADGMGPGDHPRPHEPDPGHGPPNYVADDGP